MFKNQNDQPVKQRWRLVINTQQTMTFFSLKKKKKKKEIEKEI